MTHIFVISNSGKTTERKEFIKSRKQVSQKMDPILIERNEDAQSTAEISESQEKFLNPEEKWVIKSRQNEILEKVQEKTKKLHSDANFFAMQNELLNKAEKKKNISPERVRTRH